MNKQWEEIYGRIEIISKELEGECFPEGINEAFEIRYVLTTLIWRVSNLQAFCEAHFSPEEKNIWSEMPRINTPHPPSHNE